jgi:cation diffusion facilitator family transporter
VTTPDPIEIRNPNVPDTGRSDLRAARIALAIGVALTGVKFAAYLLTNSSAVFSDALESIVNVLAGAGMLWAVYASHRPADRNHPYGHGKAEFMIAGAEGAMICLAAAVIVFRAIEQLWTGAAPEQLGIGIWLIVVATFANGAAGAWLIASGRRTQSIALQADGKHLLSDAITSVAVLVALTLVKLTGRNWIDPVTALGVAAFISVVGYRLLRASSAGLMDEQDMREDAMLRRLLDAHVGAEATSEPRICGYHKLRHRHTGRYHWVDFHLLLPPATDVDAAHRIASAIEHEIEVALGYADATAHVEPCDDAACIPRPGAAAAR